MNNIVDRPEKYSRNEVTDTEIKEILGGTVYPIYVDLLGGLVHLPELGPRVYESEDDS